VCKTVEYEPRQRLMGSFTFTDAMPVKTTVNYTKRKGKKSSRRYPVRGYWRTEGDVCSFMMRRNIVVIVLN
jgi:hypothetical protein